jgi:hypothetical protein
MITYDLLPIDIENNWRTIHMLRLFRITLSTVLVSSLFMLNSVFAATIIMPRTGQTTCYDAVGAVIACTGTGQDADKMYTGFALAPATRFTDNGNGTVTDNLTGLIWLKNANCFSYKIWSAALISANTLASGACGLTDGSTVGQWRLPNITELESLVDVERNNPALPTGHPFTSVQSSVYWSGSTGSGNNALYQGSYAWFVGMGDGVVYSSGKSDGNYVWPVRAGQ